MSATISQRELRNDSGSIMRRVEQGETFTVTRNGVPVADLMPHDSSATAQRQRFVPVERIAAGVDNLPSWGVDWFGDELTGLDNTVDDRDIDPWAGAESRAR